VEFVDWFVDFTGTFYFQSLCVACKFRGESVSVDGEKVVDVIMIELNLQRSPFDDKKTFSFGLRCDADLAFLRLFLFVEGTFCALLDMGGDGTENEWTAGRWVKLRFEEF
jgi:hypothetical protein